MANAIGMKTGAAVSETSFEALRELIAQRIESRRAPRAPSRTSSLAILLVPVLVLSFMVSRTGQYTPGVGVGYLLGVLGSSFMLLLLLYPLRKRIRVMRNLGATRHWFAAHMLLGITGPLFILMHSTYRIGSINAAVALSSMLLVALSGLIGRFIYTRIHHGLYGEQARLKELQTQVSGIEQRLSGELKGFAHIREMLSQFQAAALREEQGGSIGLWGLLTLGFLASWTALRAQYELARIGLPRSSRARGDREELAAQMRELSRLIAAYVGSVVKVAQFSTYQRMFSWWHVLHVPLVYMLVLSAVAHVVAVHIY
jgi:hypothetical protein